MTSAPNQQYAPNHQYAPNLPLPEKDIVVYVFSRDKENEIASKIVKTFLNADVIADFRLFRGIKIAGNVNISRLKDLHISKRAKDLIVEIKEAYAMKFRGKGNFEGLLSQAFSGQNTVKFLRPMVDINVTPMQYKEYDIFRIRDDGQSMEQDGYVDEHTSLVLPMYKEDPQPNHEQDLAPLQNFVSQHFPDVKF